MSSIAAVNDGDTWSVEREPPRTDADDTAAIGCAALAETAQKAHEAAQNEETTLLFSDYTGKGSIINHLA